MAFLDTLGNAVAALRSGSQPSAQFGPVSPLSSAVRPQQGFNRWRYIWDLLPDHYKRSMTFEQWLQSMPMLRGTGMMADIERPMPRFFDALTSAVAGGGGGGPSPDIL